MKYQHIYNINIFAIIRKHQYIMKTSTYQENISISVITCETGMLRAPRPGCVSSSMATTCYILHLKHFKINVGYLKPVLQNVIFLHRSFLSNQTYPKKKRVNRDKFFTFKVINWHKKQILGQKYQTFILKAVLKKNATVVVKVCPKTTCFVFPQTFYPNFSIFLHSHI